MVTASPPTLVVPKLLEFDTLLMLRVEFGEARLYHLKGFWKSYRNWNFSRSWIVTSLEADMLAAIVRCTSHTFPPSVPLVKEGRATMQESPQFSTKLPSNP